MISVASAIVVMALVLRDRPSGTTAEAPSPTIVVGQPGGQVFPATTPTPTATGTATPRPSPSPPAVDAASPSPTATPAPTPSTSPAPTPPIVAAATPEPTNPPVIVATASPADAVAAFYGHVVASDYDAAYALWSDRMKSAYPREGNLDNRFAETETITFDQLTVADQTATTAIVQANFTETYEPGGSRQFIGFWELVLVDGRWRLDAPHY